MSNPSYKIALIGYGKMGKTIEQLAISMGHNIVAKFDSNNPLTEEKLLASSADFAIEFTRPEAAAENISICAKAQVPVAVGTTGWLNKLPEVKATLEANSSKMLYASNFSIGVNILFEINRKLASIMSSFPEYGVEIEEVHHTQKLDAPSGTAISLAEGILDNIPDLNGWSLHENLKEDADDIPIKAIRQDDVKGIHHVTYTSSIDKIEISHEAFNRNGFAQGSILAGIFLCKQKEAGVYTIKDFFKSL
ncbi:4-hydroxy-tetrahydrodipicolinate reductase [Luteibaculum oceani]|uniref:4-hydroxy-tetrahydrodipicolinate reductase n=1 Tax=Luteibaculum oceani TaxID=1294296 RepID=A0A5C6UXU9_9FLAO|nr:4-hydroxy-tetrahydrodipicolinate reductase [Luteibaculum oceani]TXC77071.1 4-hydroxy-tetrahydrodipicolinate reductase [Luteibaculum oceani]